MVSGVRAKKAEYAWHLAHQLGASSNDENGILAELQRSKRIHLLEGPEP